MLRITTTQMNTLTKISSDKRISYGEIPSGHDVVVVNDLNESFQARLLGDGLWSRSLDNLARVLRNSCDQCVTVRSVLGSIVVAPHDHGLSTSIPSLKKDNDLIRFQKLHHPDQE